MTLQVGVKVLLKNKEGRFLLLKRSKEAYPDINNRWDIVGGRINSGVGLFENLKREVKEETQLDLIEEPQLVAAQDLIFGDKHVVRLTYMGAIEGEPAVDPAEHETCEWLTFDEIKQIDGLDQYFREVLNEILHKDI